MQELPIKIFFYIGVLLLIVAMVSVFLYSHGMTATRKSIYVSSIFMLLGFVSWGGVVFILKPTQILLTVYFLLFAGCVTGIYLAGVIGSLVMRDKMPHWRDQMKK